MTLQGKAAIVIWNGIAAAGRDEFFAWHNREHILERVATPGFRRGRRYAALRGLPEFFTLYEVEEPAMLRAGPYLERLATPTPWTRRAVVHFTDTARALARVLVTSGLGQGGVIGTLRLEAPASAEPALAEAIGTLSAKALQADPSLLGVHLCAADLEASNAETAERKARGSATEVPALIVLVEGGDAACVEAVMDGALADAELQRHGITAPAHRGLYRHEITIAKDEAGAA